uniref:Uncharacterized protein n=1 Tax=Meloidogyne incognita TaxID=6306 RepID=A0A914L1D0_MELIC
MNIIVRITILLIISIILSIVHARNTATIKIASGLKTRATLHNLCNNTLEDDNEYARYCDVTVSSAIFGVTSNCDLYFNQTRIKTLPIDKERCEGFFNSTDHSDYCKIFLDGAYLRCMCHPIKECCIYTEDTLLAAVEPYCKIFSSNIINNAKEICSDYKLCKSIHNLEAKKARQDCYNAFGISVAEDAVPFEIFKAYIRITLTRRHSEQKK